MEQQELEERVRRFLEEEQARNRKAEEYYVWSDEEQITHEEPHETTTATLTRTRTRTDAGAGSPPGGGGGRPSGSGETRDPGPGGAPGGGGKGSPSAGPPRAPDPPDPGGSGDDDESKEKPRAKEKAKRDEKGFSTPPEDSGDSSSDDSERTKKIKKKIRAHEKKRKGKESDEVKIGSLPNAVQFRSWKNTTRTAIVSASAKPEKRLAWINEAEDTAMGKAKAFDELAKSGPFDTLDMKIASALLARASGELGKKMNLTAEISGNAGLLIKGRQLLHMVYEHYATNERLGSLYSVFDVSKISLKNAGELLA